MRLLQLNLPTYPPTDISSSPSIDTCSCLSTQSAILRGSSAINIHIFTIRAIFIKINIISIAAYPSVIARLIVNHVIMVLSPSSALPAVSNTTLF